LQKQNKVSEKEIALQNRVKNLQAMLKMVSMEKDRLAQFSMVERSVEQDETRTTIQNLQKQLEKYKNASRNENLQEDVTVLMNENDALMRKMRYVTRTLQQSSKELDRIPSLKHLSRELQRWFETTMK
jgi:coenzyme F420-reducing hydrogenase delta subunit